MPHTNSGGISLSIVLIIPDTHSPWMHPHALDFLSDLKREYKPDKIVHLGDEFDAHSLGKWSHDPDGLSAGDEYKKALAQIKPLYKLFPNVSICTSNHSARPFRKAFESGIPKVYMRAYREFMEAPLGWRWEDSFEIDKVIYIHGEGFSGRDGAIKAATGHRKSLVCGHIHSFAGVTYLAGHHDQIFGFNCGALIDYKAYAFAYGRNLSNKPVMGAGIVINGREARFIPL